MIKPGQKSVHFASMVSGTFTRHACYRQSSWMCAHCARFPRTGKNSLHKTQQQLAIFSPKVDHSRSAAWELLRHGYTHIDSNTKRRTTCHPVGVSIVMPRHVGRLELARAWVFSANVPSHFDVESSLLDVHAASGRALFRVCVFLGSLLLESCKFGVDRQVSFYCHDSRSSNIVIGAVYGVVKVWCSQNLLPGFLVANSAPYGVA